MQKIFFLLFLLPLFAAAQTKEITLEDIHKKGTFRGEFIRGFDAADISTAVGNKAPTDEKGKKILLTNTVVSPNQKLLVALTETEPIYRHSSKSYAYLYNIEADKTIKLDDTKLLHVTFSPDNTKIAYVKDNNLYLYDIATATTKPITTDGKWNKIINGNCDWVYEEEFSFTQAYQWSEKGNYIAYYRFDESNVNEYQFTEYDDAYNKQYIYKYPKAGDPNSVVEIHIYDIKNATQKEAKFEKGDIYIPRIKWTKDDSRLLIYWLNRHQNDLRLLLTDAQTGNSNLFFEEKNKYYVDITDDWWFLQDGKNLLFSSEMSGYRHLYLKSMDGKTQLQLTNGAYEVTDVNGIDEKNKRIYYTMAYPRPMDRNIFVTDFAGKHTTQLTVGEAWHKAKFNDDFTQVNIYRSDINTPETVVLNDITGNKKKITLKSVKSLGENSMLKKKMQEYGYGQATFMQIPNRNGEILNGWMLKPANFDENKQYPVLFCNYGGPGSQQVRNGFGAVNAWHQMMAQKGFIVVSVDNTGTGFRGEEFKKKTYLQLGKLEIEDQIDAAKYLNNLPFIDKNNIGHWGWSFGGFMSSLAITKGADVFTAAVAVAPVSSWRYYDNIYTERYMRTPQENKKGYDENAPVNFTDSIKGKYMIIHGTADDNVHFQNATQMITALVKSNIDFESGYYPNKNHGISGGVDNTSFHLWSKMTNWILTNLGNKNTAKPLGSYGKKGF